MAISLAASWLVGAVPLSAQTKNAPIEIDWPAKELPRPVPIRSESIPVPTWTPVLPDSRIKTVTFSRPPAALLKANASGMMTSQAPGGRPAPAMDAEGDLVFRTELPGADRLFERKSESQFYETIRAEAQARGGALRPVFPERVPVSKEKFQPRQFPEMVESIEPSFVMHRRLLFEQPNFDRHGWELGNLQPGVSTLRFVYDVVALPYHTWTRPLQKWDSSAGKCLPGDATPLFLYREKLSFTGLVAQAGVVAGGFLAFP